MIPYLFHIGPFYFNMYGFCIAMGLLIFLWAASKDNLTKKHFKPNKLSNLTILCVITGIFGARILNIFQEQYDSLYEMIALWDGGLSLQGGVIAIAITLALYAYIKKIKLWPILDIAGIYTPLLQSISRLGCFFAGCCYGYETNLPWSIIYTHPDSRAALCVTCHPTQLYSAIGLFLLFILIKFVLQPYLRKPGQLASVYLIGSSLERFINDFFRASHYEEPLFLNTISTSQLIALCLFGAGLILLIITSSAKNKYYSL